MRPASSQRHFPYKHPTFGTSKRPKGPSVWRTSVYYWWWQYLRRSDRYLLTCASGGHGDLRELYESFGDVRSDDFKKWWSTESRGFRLFAEPKAIDSFRVVTQPSELLLNESTLVVSMPLALPKRFLLRKTSELLRDVHPGRRGMQAAKVSRATFRVNGQPNLPALETALRVWDYRKANPTMPLWQVGQSLTRFKDAQKIVRDDPDAVQVAKKNVLAATVSRYIRRANLTIVATELGQFPSSRAIPTKPIQQALA